MSVSAENERPLFQFALVAVAFAFFGVLPAALFGLLGVPFLPWLFSRLCWFLAVACALFEAKLFGTSLFRLGLYLLVLVPRLIFSLGYRGNDSMDSAYQLTFYLIFAIPAGLFPLLLAEFLFSRERYSLKVMAIPLMLSLSFAVPLTLELVAL